ncbi:putative transcriptional regulator, TetR family protein [Catellatospora sp. TT07R-123]|uniref:TetR/AcrR family transcriptional regulator n=1 Tax=Catellatospora sp. TT07R-123 TaxID=2733863 RepID=UPI001B0E3B21|nr:TetR/AcrR family transcriptional regulator [Catellatospora sp. TT07R-123]GHJ48341.1 putative transcriptional regulator, TetR family protein [Catellatospora sp. TT07R-123]
MATQRTPNRRGEGSKLRDDLIAAATALLEEAGSEDAISLRGVARRAGVTAPSIYAHFASREEILVAVIAEVYEDMTAAMTAAYEEPDPHARLRGLCCAYLDFAHAHPHRYRVVFGRSRTGEVGRLELEELTGGKAFAQFRAAVAEVAGPADANMAAITLWVALHGYATLAASVPAFPWPQRDAMVDWLIRTASEPSSVEHR